MSKADERNDVSVEGYISSIDDETAIKDARSLVKMFQKVSGQKPQLYGIGTIGFGIYHYKYDSGREGDAHTIGFYPGKGKITVYLMDGTKRYSDLLARLGKHTTTGYCVYIKQLSEIDMSVLEKIVCESYEHITTKYKEGPIDQILWQADK